MLPQLTTPIYDLTLPSNGKEIRVRPFLVKEEKLLLMAAQSKDTVDIINATKQVISNCILDEGVSINDMPFFDVDYLFLTLRAKSISENIDINFSCNNIFEGKKCGAIFPVTLDISKSSITKNENIKDEIWLSEKFGIKMKYPKYSEMKKIVSDESQLDKRIRIIQACIDYMFDDKQTYPSKEMSKEDMDKFIDELTTSQLDKLGNWVDALPELEIKVQKQCPTCGFNHNISYKEFTSFFF